MSLCMCVCDEMTVHVSVPGPGLPSPRPSCPGCCLHPCCPHPSGSVPRPQWAGVTGRSPSPLWVTHWEAGRRGSCLPQPRTHPFCPESLAPRGQAGWAGLGWDAQSQAPVALHVGHPSEALQVSRGQHPYFPILASEGSPGGGPGEGLGLVHERRSPRLDFRCECVTDRQTSHQLPEFTPSFIPPAPPLAPRAEAEGGWDVRKGSPPGGGAGRI